MSKRLHLLIFACFSLIFANAIAQSDDLTNAKEAVKKRDYATAAKLLQPLADQGDATAMTMLAKMRLAGQGVIKDESIAVELLIKAADASNAEAIFLLGRQTHSGNGLPKDEVRAVSLYLKAAELDNADGMTWYALSIYRGYGGLTADKAASVEWFRRAANKGNSVAQNWLGSLYAAGEGLEKNPYEAISWYRKAALQLEPNAQRNLGAAYARGQGVARDDNEAFKWLHSAAYLRDIPALEWVGSFYETGRAVLPDLVSSHMWYTLALARDPSRTQVKTALDRVAAKLTPAQLTESQNKAKQWPNPTEMTKALLATGALGSANAPITSNAVAASTLPSSNFSGSGFVMGPAPHFVVTNHHVVKGCKKILVMPFNLEATVRAIDERNDLALLNVPNLSAVPLKLRSGRSIRPGDELVTVGFPLAGILATGASVSTGSLTNLGGINNDTSRFQISVPAQPGNSGGPVLDNYGQVVGVVVAQINAVKVSQVSGSIPQNINFAINTATLSSFLEASGVDFALSMLHQDPKVKRKDAADIGALGRKSTVKVECSPS